MLPSEAILPLAGFAASRGDINVLAVIVAATVGSPRRLPGALSQHAGYSRRIPAVLRYLGS